MSNSFLFLSADFPWVYLLAKALAPYGPTKVSRLCHYLNYDRTKFGAEMQSSETLHYENWVFPPGYGGKLEPVGRHLLRARIQKAVRELQKRSGDHPWVVVPLPYVYGGLSEIPSERLIYYNLDDYSCYPRGWNPRVAAYENALIGRSAVTVCLSRHQVEQFRSRHPNRQVRHLPLAVATSFIHPSPGSDISDRFTVGYVGSLTDRVDWTFVYETAVLCPDTDFVFVGRLDEGATVGGNRANWAEQRARALALPNIRHAGSVPQGEVPRFYWSFGMSWIPYDIEHRFNLAACPTKIMDGIAAGRPVLSTALPECKLHPEWISIAENPQEAQMAIASVKAGIGSSEARAKAVAQVEFARGNDWNARAETLLNMILHPQPSISATPAASIAS
jgi:teichuronic acid biosynthesis glycosyltransferase TuaH